MKDTWNSSDPYEYFMGRWSKLVAIKFLEWLSPLEGLSWIDVGCGTGALSEIVIEKSKPEKIIAIDQSDGFVISTQKRLGNQAICKIGNALDLPVDDDNADMTISGLVLNFIPDVTKALSEMKRVTKSKGEVAIYIWDYAGKMDFLQIFWEAATELNPSVSDLNEANRFVEFNSDLIKNEFKKADFKSVKAKTIEVETCFTEFDDYWLPFLGGQGPAPSYLLSLNDKDKEFLKNLIYQRLPIQKNGIIQLTAKALAIKGIVLK